MPVVVYNVNRYNLIRMRSKYLGGRWAPVCRPVRNAARSLVLKRCNMKLNGLGKHECQVLACDTTHDWICPIDPLVLQLGCLKFKRRKIEVEVREGEEGS